MNRFSRQLPTLLLALAMTAVVTSCDPAVPEGAVTGDCSSENLFKGSEQYFNDTMVPQVFEPYCSYCHWSDKTGETDRKGATPGLNYDDFASAISRNSTVFSATWVEMSAQTMPPMGKLPSSEELQMVLDWINCEIAARPQGDDDDSATQ